MREHLLELGEHDLELGAQLVDGRPAPQREPFPRGGEVAQVGVAGGEEREADELALGHQVGDDQGVLGIGLERLAVDDLLPVLGVGGQDADDAVALLGEIVREGEPVAAGELDADQDLGGRCLRGLLPQEGQGGLEAGARGAEQQRLAVGAAPGAGHEGMGELAGIHADTQGGALGPRPLREADHRNLRAAGEVRVCHGPAVRATGARRLSLVGPESGQ